MGRGQTREKAGVIAIGTLISITAGCDDRVAPQPAAPHAAVAAEKARPAIGDDAPISSATTAPTPVGLSGPVASAAPTENAPAGSASSPPALPAPNGASIAFVIARAVKHAAVKPTAAPTPGQTGPLGANNNCGGLAGPIRTSGKQVNGNVCGAVRQPNNVNAVVREINVDVGLVARTGLPPDDLLRVNRALGTVHRGVKLCAQRVLDQMPDHSQLTATVNVSKSPPHFTVETPNASLSACVTQILDSALVIPNEAGSLASFQIAIDPS